MEIVKLGRKALPATFLMECCECETLFRFSPRTDAKPSTVDGRREWWVDCPGCGATLYVKGLTS